MKDVDFLFVYEVRNRELEAICLIGAYLEEKGYKVEYVNSWDCLYHFHRKNNTRVAILSACYDDKTYCYFSSHAKSFEKVIDLQWEQVLINMVTLSEVQTGWDFREEALSIRHICWGDNNREYLMSKFGFSEDKTHVCGYVPLDFYREEFRNVTMTRDELFSKYALDVKKKTILFISSFSDVGKPESEIALIEGDPQDVRDHIELQAESQEIIFGWFERLAKEDDSLQIIYRPHPAEAERSTFFSRAKGIPNFHIIAGESIRNWIMNCDILCNWQSTSMIELYASGKKTMLLRPVEIPYKLSMPIFEEGHYFAVRSYEELKGQICEGKAVFPIEESSLLQFYSITEKPAYERTGDYLIQTLNDAGYQSRNLNKYHSDYYEFLRVIKNRIVATIASIAYYIVPVREHTTEYSFLDNIAERCLHDKYFIQKAKQNKASKEEIRNITDSYKAIIKSKKYSNLPR